MVENHKIHTWLSPDSQVSVCWHLPRSVSCDETASCYPGLKTKSNAIFAGCTFLCLHGQLCAPLGTLGTGLLPLPALLLRFHSPEGCIVLLDLPRPLWFCLAVTSPTTGSTLALRSGSSLPKRALACNRTKTGAVFIRLQQRKIYCDSRL